MYKINQFSGRAYLDAGNLKTSDTGQVFVKVGDDYIAPNGDYIKQIGNDLINLRTGVNSTFGDPFGGNHE